MQHQTVGESKRALTMQKIEKRLFSASFFVGCQQYNFQTVANNDAAANHI